MHYVLLLRVFSLRNAIRGSRAYESGYLYDSLSSIIPKQTINADSFLLGQQRPFHVEHSG
jgi:hypothetical protein